MFVSQVAVVTCNSEFASFVQSIGVAYSSSWSYLCYMTLSVAIIRLMYFFMHSAFVMETNNLITIYITYLVEL